MFVDKVKAAYGSIQVGEETWIRADGSDLAALQTFQAVVEGANIYQGQGLIFVLPDAHRESSTGRRLIDAFRIRKLR
jgi:hypothetical protein